jgi:hypothetical protein
MVQSPMSKPLRSRPIDLCLEETANRCDAAIIELKRANWPSSDRVGATAYSRVRSLRGLLIGQTVCIAIPLSMNNAEFRNLTFSS